MGGTDKREMSTFSFYLLISGCTGRIAIMFQALPQAKTLRKWACSVIQSKVWVFLVVMCGCESWRRLSAKELLLNCTGEDS